MTHRFIRPPRALRKARLDNLALVPASMLVYKEQWVRLANTLPSGGVLILLPNGGNARATAKAVADALKADGRHVMIPTRGTLTLPLEASRAPRHGSTSHESLIQRRRPPPIVLLNRPLIILAMHSLKPAALDKALSCKSN